MAYTVNFGTMVKKVNSTKRDFTVTVTAACSLKEPSSVQAPVFTFQGDFPAASNYFTVNEWGRYYWITSSKFVLGHWEISGRVDVMATFKDQIGSQAQYIVRSAAIRNGNIRDNYAVPMAGPTVSSQATGFGLSGTGAFIVCTAGVSGNRYYMMDSATWAQLYAMVFSNQFLVAYESFWTNIVSELTNQVFNPADYIVNAIWVPAPVTGAAANITLGFINTGLTGYIVNPSDIIVAADISLAAAAHPQTDALGAYVNGAGYRQVELFLTGYGNVVLDPDILYTGGNAVRVLCQMDITGTLAYDILYGQKELYMTTNLACQAGYSQSNGSMIGSAASIAGAAAGTATGNLAGAITSIGSAISNVIPGIERSSPGGSRVASASTTGVRLTTKCYPVKDSSFRVGYPTCETIAPYAVGGYMQTQHASVECNGTDSEITEINATMDGGFYYE